MITRNTQAEWWCELFNTSDICVNRWVIPANIFIYTFNRGKDSLLCVTVSRHLNLLAYITCVYLTHRRVLDGFVINQSGKFWSGGQFEIREFSPAVDVKPLTAASTSVFHSSFFSNKATEIRLSGNFISDLRSAQSRCVHWPVYWMNSRNSQQTPSARWVINNFNLLPGNYRILNSVKNTTHNYVSFSTLLITGDLLPHSKSPTQLCRKLHCGKSTPSLEHHSAICVDWFQNHRR